MRRLLPLVLIAPLALAACQKAGQPAGAPPPAATAASDASASADVSSTAAAAPPGAPAAAKKPVPPQAPPAAPAALPMLAYSYDYGVEAPPQKIRALVAEAQGACEAAGAAACEITGADVSQSGPDAVTAKLTLKAAPAWLKGYEDRLSHDAEASGGRLIHAAVSTEDLSRQIVDTQAAIRAKTALRDRLQAMLETRAAKLDDLVDLEEKLADIQGDLDATASELAAMQERVATSDVTIEYDSAGVLAPRGAWSPVGKAVGSIAGIFGGTIAAMIYILAFALPWAILVGLGAWIFRRRWVRRLMPTPTAKPGGDKG